MGPGLEKRVIANGAPIERTGRHGLGTICCFPQGLHPPGICGASTQQAQDPLQVAVGHLLPSQSGFGQSLVPRAQI